MPNGRTIYKILMKRASETFWGDRAFVTVRLPISLVSVPCPPNDYCKDWGDPTYSGWKKYVGDGIIERRSVYKESQYSFDDDADPNCNCWCGEISIEDRKNGGYFTALMPDEDILSHVALAEWQEKYLNGIGDRDDLHPVHKAFLDCRRFAATHYPRLSEDKRYMYFTYSVKHRYHNRKMRFCADLKRAFRLSKKHGINAKLMR